MAMINCPECGKEISDQAESCIHCGCPIKASETTSEEKTNQVVFVEDNAKSAQKNFMISMILSAVGSAIIDFFLLYLMLLPEGKSTTSSDATLTFHYESRSAVPFMVDVLESNVGIVIILLVLLLPFLSCLFSFLAKEKTKQRSAFGSLACCALGILTIVLIMLSDSTALCFLPIFFTPMCLFLVSGILNLVGALQYGKRNQ